ncbi:MAG TPA: Gfo/Idh/MocA family oxidoreductase [Actinomycetota bacterium]|nr:Gfo/Idh/MocA family oxidoreductase [Actinomycetota bacterium]
MSAEALRWGILSTARIGVDKVVPATASAARCEVVAIASRDPDRARAAAAGLGIGRAFGTYEELLADPDVDAVYIPLPNHLHAPWTIAAARAGKHVLCEKPLAMNPAEAERMIQACQAEGVLLMEAFMYRLHPTWEAVRELVASGRIGELRAVQGWFSYFNDDPSDIRNIVGSGGGALYDIGCYAVNLSRMLFGKEPSRIRGSVTRDPVMGIDVLTSGILEFPEGVASFTCSTRVEPDQRVHVYGTRGRISLEIPFNIPPDLPTRVFVTAGGDPPVRPETETLTFDPVDEYAIQAERFAAAVLDGTPVPIPPSDAVGNMRVIEELFRIG